MKEVTGMSQSSTAVHEPLLRIAKRDGTMIAPGSLAASVRHCHSCWHWSSAALFICSVAGLQPARRLRRYVCRRLGFPNSGPGVS